MREHRLNIDYEDCWCDFFLSLSMWQMFQSGFEFTSWWRASMRRCRLTVDIIKNSNLLIINLDWSEQNRRIIFLLPARTHGRKQLFVIQSSHAIRIKLSSFSRLKIFWSMARENFPRSNEFVVHRLHWE